MASGVPRSCRDGEECEPLRHPGVLEQNPVAGQSKKQGFLFRVCPLVLEWQV